MEQSGISATNHGGNGSSGNGSGGIEVTATDDISISQASLNADTYSDGHAGDIQLSADTIDLSVATGGEGTGGQLDVIANTINVSDGSQIESSSLQEIGFTSEETYNFETQQIGNLNLITPTLPLGTTYGDAGNVIIAASNVNVQGTDNSGTVSRITARSRTNGAAGSVDISARSFTVQDQGQVSVSGFSTGSAGNLIVESDAIRLRSNASLQADVTQGNQGIST